MPDAEFWEKVKVDRDKGLAAMDRWHYDSRTGLYFLDGIGIGLTWSEVEAIEDGVEEHEERKRRRLAEANEY